MRAKPMELSAVQFTAHPSVENHPIVWLIKKKTTSADTDVEFLGSKKTPRRVRIYWAVNL